MVIRLFIIFSLIWVSSAAVSADCFMEDSTHLESDIRIERYRSQAMFYLNEMSDTTCAIANLKAALVIAKGDSLQRETAGLLILFADVYYQVGEFGKAYPIYSAALKIAKQYNFTREAALCLKGISHIDWRYGDYISSISHILGSIKLYEELGDTVGIIESTNILAGIYTSQEKLDEAEMLYDNMFRLAEDIGDSVLIAENYEFRGVVKFYKKYYQEAIDNYMLALAINLNLGLELKNSINLGNIGEAHHLLGNYESALSNYITAQKIQEKYQFNSGLIFLNYSKGNTYTSLGNFTMGIVHYEKSLLLMEATGEEREKNLVLQLIAENYALQRNFEKAYAYKKLQVQLKDSVFNSDVARQFDEIRAKYEFENKERENLILVQENQLRKIENQSNRKVINLQYAVGFLLLTFLCAAIFFSIKLFSQKKKMDAVNRTKDKLFNIIGHDLKGPVGNLKSIIDLIIHDQRLTEDEYFIKALSSLKKSVHAAYFLLIDLLSWSVMQKEGIVLKPETLDMKDLITRNIDLLAYQAKEKQIVIVNNIPEEGKVHADESTISTVVRNLLSNAIKFTQKGGEIILKGEFMPSGRERGEEKYQISVIDSGVGIPKDKMKGLFQFIQLESTYGTEKEKGSGLGLSICKEFIEKNNGKISVVSELGNGSTFYFTLPAMT